MPPYERTEKVKRDMQISQTIIEQLGGTGRLKSMTGARNFVAIDNGLSFRMPSRFAQKGINCVEIVLTPADTYSVQFLKIGPSPNFTITTVSEHRGIYGDMLRELFEHETGLHLTLGKVVMRQPDYGTMKGKGTASKKSRTPPSRLSR
jgi:hypothetical protein